MKSSKFLSILFGRNPFLLRKFLFFSDLRSDPHSANLYINLSCHLIHLNTSQNLAEQLYGQLISAKNLKGWDRFGQTER